MGSGAGVAQISGNSVGGLDGDGASEGRIDVSKAGLD